MRGNINHPYNFKFSIILREFLSYYNFNNYSLNISIVAEDDLLLLKKLFQVLLVITYIPKYNFFLFLLAIPIASKCLTISSIISFKGIFKFLDFLPY